MTARFLGVGAIVVSVASFAAGACGAATHRASYPAAVHAREFVLGRSVEGRGIVAHVVGSPSAPRRILVVGCVHGNERAGEAITRRLRTVTPPAGSALWLVDEFNPDGCLRGTRQNAHGVDLNRNSPWHWRPLEQPGGTFYSGIAPLSEPESRAIHALVARLRPEISIWYHQHASLVDDSSGGSSAIEGRYGARRRLAPSQLRDLSRKHHELAELGVPARHGVRRRAARRSAARVERRAARRRDPDVGREA